MGRHSAEWIAGGGCFVGNGEMRAGSSRRKKVNVRIGDIADRPGGRYATSQGKDGWRPSHHLGELCSSFLFHGHCDSVTLDTLYARINVILKE